MAEESLELRKVGLKATLPRVRIMQILNGASEHHMSAEDVYRALLEAEEDVGLATVYRVLTQFEGAGLVTRHHFDETHSVFELNHGDHHDHMVCVDSGKVIEFHNDDIETLQEQIAREHDCDLVGHTLILYVKPRK